jgi:small multidrug resistance family-3 protein
MIARSVALFAIAAVVEIAGVYLIWIGLRSERGLLPTVAGVLALGLYGVLAAAQPQNEFGRVLAAYGALFIVISLLWGAALTGFVPDRYDLVGVALCLCGAGTLMYAPR